MNKSPKQTPYQKGTQMANEIFHITSHQGNVKLKQ